MKRNKDSWDTSKSDCHNPYTDEEIEIILRFVITVDDCAILGRLLQRSTGSIKRIVEMAHLPSSDVKKLKVGKGRVESKYHGQVKRIAKEVGIIRGYNIYKNKGKKT
tara:strand:+ start:52344 stop:52664 length:321 start_codon:yes stop_codon:yes gene_type:complete